MVNQLFLKKFEKTTAGSQTAFNYKRMLPNNDNKAIMATMNNALILEINIIFFVDFFRGGREQVHDMRVQNSLNGRYVVTACIEKYTLYL